MVIHFFRCTDLHEEMQAGVEWEGCFVCCLMYHGYARRPGRPRDAPWFRGDSPRLRLRIARNVFRVPWLTMPAGNVVVTEQLREQLCGLRSIECVEAKVERAVFIPWSEERYGHLLKYRRYVRERAIFAKMPPMSREWKAFVPRLYEVITPLYERVVDGIGGGREIAGESIGTAFFEECAMPFRATVSRTMLAKYPIMYHLAGCHILSDEAFRILEPHLDVRYFAVEHVELPG